jgi:transcriptional regulator with XRE-family HTH domain
MGNAMHSFEHNVLRQTPESSEPQRSLFGKPTGRTYRSAVAQAVREIKAAHRLSNEQLAERVGVSEGTIYNAENEAGDLAAVTLLNLAYAFGESAIAAVRDLYLCAPAEPLTPAERVERAMRELRLAQKEMEG